LTGRSPRRSARRSGRGRRSSRRQACSCALPRAPTNWCAAPAPSSPSTVPLTFRIIIGWSIPNACARPSCGGRRSRARSALRKPPTGTANRAGFSGLLESDDLVVERELVDVLAGQAIVDPRRLSLLERVFVTGHHHA